MRRCRPASGPAMQKPHVQVANLTTLQASLRFVQSGRKPLALNFADGIQPGGGFHDGAHAQEEVLCRSSALYSTLVDDPMYTYHRGRGQARGEQLGDLLAGCPGLPHG